MTGFCFRRYCLAVLALLVAVPGCGRSGPRPVPVSGTVRVEGKPLAGGFIRVLPLDGKAAEGKIDSQGRFTLMTFKEGDGCLPGTHPVEVIANQMTGGEDSPGSGGLSNWLAPKEYANYQTSGLEVTITGPTDSLTIELSATPPVVKAPRGP